MLVRPAGLDAAGLQLETRGHFFKLVVTTLTRLNRTQVLPGAPYGFAPRVATQLQRHPVAVDRRVISAVTCLGPWWASRVVSADGAAMMRGLPLSPA